MVVMSSQVLRNLLVLNGIGPYIYIYIFYLQCTHIIYLANLNISNKNMKIMCELIAAAERIIKMKGNSLITQK